MEDKERESIDIDISRARSRKDKVENMLKILDVAREPVKLTTMMYKTFQSFSELQQYVNILKDLDLLAEVKTPVKGYITTQKGLKMLKFISGETTLDESAPQSDEEKRLSDYITVETPAIWERILQSVKEKPELKTHIAYESRIDSRTTAKYLRFLASLHLIKETRYGKITLTKKGLELLKQYSKLRTFSEDQPKTVTVVKDEEEGKEWIDVDLDKLEADKFYLVNYAGEMQAVRKISEHKLAFYDVIL